MAARNCAAGSISCGSSPLGGAPGSPRTRSSIRPRRARFARIWILDRTVRPALAARLAGIPERIGVGFARQRPFITNAGVDESHFHEMPTDWLRELLATMCVPLPTTEPNLTLPPVIFADLAH